MTLQPRKNAKGPLALFIRNAIDNKTIKFVASNFVGIWWKPSNVYMIISYEQYRSLLKSNEGKKTIIGWLNCKIPLATRGEGSFDMSEDDMRKALNGDVSG